MKKLAAFLILLACIVGVGRGWYLLKDGFSVRRLEGSFPLTHQPIQPLSSETRTALAQRYTYLGRGRQCYAFASEDGRYVLKLPRMDLYTVRLWRCHFPWLVQKRRTAYLRRKQKVGESFLIAERELKDQTGVLYCHLGPTAHIGIRLQAKDACGSCFQLDLDQHPFILQKKIPNLIDALLQAVSLHDKKQAQKILGAYLDVIVARAQKGIFNKDDGFLGNFGFDGKKGYQIDVGSFYYKAGVGGSEAFALSLQETVDQISPWIQQVDPSLHQWFQEQVKNELAVSAQRR